MDRGTRLLNCSRGSVVSSGTLSVGGTCGKHLKLVDICLLLRAVTRIEDIKPDETRSRRRNVVCRDALDVSRYVCDRLEIRAVGAHLNIEIAGIQIEVVSTCSGVLYDKPADCFCSSEIELQKWTWC